MPPSLHDSGERRVWYQEQAAAGVEGTALMEGVADIATAALIARNWPGQGARHDYAMAAAVEAIRQVKVGTPALDEALAEPLLPDENKLTALIAEMAELLAQQSRALDHVDTQVVASQDREIRRLQERVDKLEGASKGGAKGGTRKK